jgi:cytidine deaminase
MKEAMRYLSNPGNQVMDTTLQIQKLNSPRLAHLDNELNANTWELIVGEYAMPALFKAQEAYRAALSYRNFRVGACAVTIMTDQPILQTQMLCGANIKTASDDTINTHAEHMVISQIRQATRKSDTGPVVPLLAIVGDLQNDQQSGQPMLTLHPCGKCRDTFAEPDSPIGPETTIVTATNDLRTLQISNLAILQAYHNGNTQNSGIITLRMPHAPNSLDQVLDQILAHEPPRDSDSANSAATWGDRDTRTADAEINLRLVTPITRSARRNWLKQAKHWPPASGRAKNMRADFADYWPFTQSVETKNPATGAGTLNH